MKKLFIAALLLLPLTVFANGENNGPKCNNRSCNETTNFNFSDDSTTNKAYGGDATAKAYGGSAYQGQHQGQGQGQDQGQYQKNTGINGQGQSLTNNGPQVTLEQTYEAQERDPVSSAYGHASHRYECVVGIGGGAQAANFGISISGGYESELCNMGFVAKFLSPDDPRLAKIIDAMVDKVLFADTPEGPAAYSPPDN